MIAALLRYGPAAGLAILSLVVWLQMGHIDAQEDAIKRADDALATAQTDLKNARKAMQETSTAIDTMRADMAGVLAQQDALRIGLGQRETEIGAMQRDVKEIRDWAGTVLPADIARMRTRPAITGAAAYGDYLSRRGALRAAGDQPNQNGRPKPGH